VPVLVTDGAYCWVPLGKEFAISVGTQSIPLQTSDLPSGLYFVRLIVGNRSIAAGRFMRLN